MIVDVRKYLIFGSKEEIDRFFPLAQRAGFLEFIGASRKKALETPPAAKDLLLAVKILRKHIAEGKPYEVDLTSPPEAIAATVLRLQADLDRLSEEERLLIIEISRISIFGDFSLEDIHFLERTGKRFLQYFCMKSDLAHEKTMPAEVIYVGTEYDLDYFVAVNHELKQYPDMIEIQIPHPVGELKQRLHHVRLEKERSEHSLHLYAQAEPLLLQGIADLLNDYHLELAKNDVLFPLGGEQPLFVVEAWVPKSRIASLAALVSHLEVQCEEIAVGEGELVPTCMENKGIAKVGEDLVLLYDTPSKKDLDPSIFVLGFFAFFFALIVSDAAYGLVYLAIGLFLKWKYPYFIGTKKRLIKLLCILGGASVIWGVLTASFFGIEFSPEHTLRKGSVLSYLSMKKADYHMAEKDDVYEEYLRDYPQVSTAGGGWDFLLLVEKEGTYPALSDFSNDILLEFSLLIGIVHIGLGLLRYLARNYAGAGWVLFLIGGYLYFPSQVHATTLVNFMGWISKPVAYAYGLKILLAGIALAFILAFVQRRFLAFFELIHVTQIFSDVLSYLRLYALALAGLIMAHSFNHFAAEAGLFAGLFYLVVGHTINITMSTLAGVIHGLRLNFLEWYHYCFEGEGRLFNPLRKIKVEE